MDPQTLAAYDAHAQAFADDWHDQPAPADLHALVRRYFKPGRTADIGCGSGREVGWLNANGYPSVGYDPSDGLLAQARARYPGLPFARAALPELAGVIANSFDNVMCETVIMHLPPGLIAQSVAQLMSILKPDGVLYLSWRVTREAHRRDAHARLYAAFDRRLVLETLSGADFLLDEEATSASSGKAIHRIVARKHAKE